MFSCVSLEQRAPQDHPFEGEMPGMGRQDGLERLDLECDQVPPGFGEQVDLVAGALEHVERRLALRCGRVPLGGNVVPGPKYHEDSCDCRGHQALLR